MQNKPNLPNAQMSVNNVLTKDYENVHLRRPPKNKAKTNPIKANFKRNLTWLKMDLAMPYRKVKDAKDMTIDPHGGGQAGFSSGGA